MELRWGEVEGGGVSILLLPHLHLHQGLHLSTDLHWRKRKSGNFKNTKEKIQLRNFLRFVSKRLFFFLHFWQPIAVATYDWQPIIIILWIYKCSDTTEPLQVSPPPDKINMFLLLYLHSASTLLGTPVCISQSHGNMSFWSSTSCCLTGGDLVWWIWIWIRIRVWIQ